MAHDFNSTVRQSTLPTLPRSAARSHVNIASNASDKLTDGIRGSAMTVPPPRSDVQSVRLETSKKNRSKSKSDISASYVQSSREDNDKTRELRELLAHERQLVLQLQQVNASLRLELDEAQGNNMRLQRELEQKQKDFNEIIDEERRARLKAQEDDEEKSKEFKLKQVLLKECYQQISDLKSVAKKVEFQIRKRLLMKVCKQQLELEIFSLKEDAQREISARETKLTHLKQNMADALQGNSWQRQQQLDELSKELNKVREEADILRSTLKNVKKSGCSNCAELSQKLSRLEKTASAGDKTVADLKQLVATYEKQRVDCDVIHVISRWQS